MQTASGGPLFPWQQNTEWVDNWKFRTTPASRSRVLSGKGVETDKQYAERRKKETTKRTWRSDAADIARGIGEGVLALHPYTAIPYFGAKVGQDFLNGTYGWNTALNASIPLFHIGPNNIYNSGKQVINNSYEKFLDTGDVSYYLNKDKIIKNSRIGTNINKGSEASVYIDNNNKNRVLKVSNNLYNTKKDAVQEFKRRVQRNKNPYYLKERTEGLKLNNNGTYSPIISQKYFNTRGSIFDMSLQDKLMAKKGYVRVPVQEIDQIPIKLDSRSQALKFGPYSYTFRNGNKYMIDARLNNNSFIKDGKLINLDNDYYEFK